MPSLGPLAQNKIVVLNFNCSFYYVQEITPSGAFVTKNKDGVSASWGGFQAAASLADDGSAVASAGGNGLGAGAGYGAGGVGAGAGVYGNEAASGGSYGNGGKPGSAGGFPAYSQGGGAGNGGFFDRIFAVSVNAYKREPRAGSRAGKTCRRGHVDD